VPNADCPECKEEVYVDSDLEQGDLVSCDECGANLELVGLDPIELDLHEAKGGSSDRYDDYDSAEYEDDRY
jgi:alpha-aminoadipate carrier protein LysW